MSDAAKRSVSTRQREQYGESIAIELASNGSAVEDGSTEREDSPDFDNGIGGPPSRAQR